MKESPRHAESGGNAGAAQCLLLRTLLVKGLAARVLGLHSPKRSALACHEPVEASAQASALGSLSLAPDSQQSLPPDNHRNRTGKEKSESRMPQPKSKRKRQETDKREFQAKHPPHATEYKYSTEGRGSLDCRSPP